MNSLRKFLTCMFMVLLPLQSIAAVLAPLHCAVQAQRAATVASAVMPCHEQQTSSHSASHDASPDEGNSPSGTVTHLCCHYSCSGVATPELRSPAQKFAAVTSAVTTLVTLFIPDSPYRPPRG